MIKQINIISQYSYESDLLVFTANPRYDFCFIKTAFNKLIFYKVGGLEMAKFIGREYELTAF